MCCPQLILNTCRTIFLKIEARISNPVEITFVLVYTAMVLSNKEMTIFSYFVICLYSRIGCVLYFSIDEIASGGVYSYSLEIYTDFIRRRWNS